MKIFLYILEFKKTHLYFNAMKKIVLLFTFLNVLFVKAQVNNCLTDLDFLVKTVKTDYPGYEDKVNAENAQKLNELENLIRRKIEKYPDSCWYYLNEYTSFFKDFHLRVMKARVNNSISKKNYASTLESKIVINYDSLKQNTLNGNGIEGIWKNFSEEFAIIQNTSGYYLGVAISGFDCEEGQVVFKFIPDSTGLFNVVEYSNVEGGGTFNYAASLCLDGKILEIHEFSKYVRATNSDAFDYALLRSYIPLHPNGRNTYFVALSLSDSTFFVRLPGFNSSTTETIINKYWKEITARPNLIIDLRNNGGGQDNYYQILLKLLYTKPYLSKGVEWYVSEDNIKIFEEALIKKEVKNGEEGLKWVQVLLTTMKSNKSKFVIHPLMGADKIITRDTIYPLPRKVGIIINENNASSAEQFLLSAKNSDKVILFGNKNTAGVLDYSNAVQVLFPSNNYALLYPMTRSRRLPDYPIDNIGIAPDVIIPLKETVQLYDRLDDWVYFVMSYLEFIK